MSELSPPTAWPPSFHAPAPELVTAAGDRAAVRFLGFFAGRIRNPHTSRAYARAVADFLAWWGDAGVLDLAGVQPLHVAAWVEGLGRSHAAPTENRINPCPLRLP